MSFFSYKDPAEIVTLTFEFSPLTTTPSTPVIELSVAMGTDPNAATVLQGNPVVSGSKVLQRVANGIHNTIYELKCTALAPDGSKYVITGYLPVYNQE